MENYKSVVVKIPVEEAHKINKIKKNEKSLLTGVSNRDIYLTMPNEPDVNKSVLSLRIANEFYQRLRIASREREMGFNEYVRFLIYSACENITLEKKIMKKLNNSNKRMLSVRIPVDIHQKIRATAKALQISESDVATLFLQKGCKQSSFCN